MAIAKILCAGQIIVLVTEMDAVEWAQEKFDVVASAMSACARRIGANAETLSVIPISVTADSSENLFEKSDKASWYSGKGMLEIMEAIPKPPDLQSGPLRWAVEQCYKIKQVGDVLNGKIIQGELVVNSERELIHSKALDMCPAGDLLMVFSFREVPTIPFNGTSCVYLSTHL